MLRKYFGNRAFYARVLIIAVPIMIQSGITNFVNLLDNIMVGSLGEEALSGVAIVNQYTFVYNLMIFGAISAAGIFTAQYHGFGDTKGVRNTFRFKLIINVIASVVGIAVFFLLDDLLISLFLHDGSSKGDLLLTLKYGKEYLFITLFGLLPHAISQVYASTMRETGKTVPPMVASAVAVGTNFALNMLLIFGLCGFPKLGVVGAALATSISRYVELLILVVWGHLHKKQYAFLIGAYRSLRVPRALAVEIVRKGLPLMMNELLWALAITARSMCYSTRGLDVVAAQNINSTIVNLFNVVYLALGSSIATIVGNQLGAGSIEEAKDTDRKMIVFSVLCATGMGIVLAIFASPFGLFFDITESGRDLATFMIIVSAATMPFSAYTHAAYFTLRTGGKVMITLLFDCVYMWLVVMPGALILAYATEIGIHWLFVICQALEAAKCILGYFVLKRDDWARQLVSDHSLKS